MSNDSIRVVCRLRPINKVEMANKGEECVTYTSKDLTINVQETKYNFAFDKIFGPTTHQIEIYKQVAVPVIKSVIGGFNGTIFAYGQTGGGKTWTMEGPNHHDSQFKGLIPRTIQGMFEAISESDENIEYVIKCSYIEIYNEKLFDLLDPSKSKLQIKEDKHRGVFIQNCTEINVGSGEQMLKTMDNGSLNRKVAFTSMNQRSSRSHSLFIIHVSQKNVKKDSTKQSKLYFVDLAGSEKVGKTGVQGVQLQEAKNINKSLSSLGNVINALTSDKKQHIPYRDSKLTRILQESLGGNSKTTLIINCSMCDYNDKQTLGTLRFGYRAKSIKNKAKVNEQKSAKQLLILLDAANKSIAQLKLQLGGKIPLKMEEVQNSQQKEEMNMRVEQLKEELELKKKQQIERQSELMQMQLRVKNLLMQNSSSKDKHEFHLTTCNKIFKTLKQSLHQINKYMSRVYIDLQYLLNNLIIDGTEENNQITNNLNTTFQNIMQFTAFYDKELKNFFNQIEPEEELNDNQVQNEKRNDGIKNKKIRITYSEPNLVGGRDGVSEDLQLSCIVDNKSTQNQDNTIVQSSDKVSLSQEESFSQIETLLQSLETKESHKILLQQMSYNLRMLKKENEDLLSKNQKLIIQNKLISIKFQEQYEQTILDLQQRVEEYRNIIKQKDAQTTNYIKTIEKEKNNYLNQRVISQRLKKIIESNNGLKNLYQLEEKVRNLAADRQKLFNQLYKTRSELDQSEINLKQKEEHIQSLKEVMKELNNNNISEPAIHALSGKEIQKKYNKQVYGTQAPNVIVTVKGGSKIDNTITKLKQSSLRKKVHNFSDKRQEADKSNILPFIKGFFS